MALMFANRISRIRKFNPNSRRYSSQPSSLYPFTKLRAFPFKLSPQDATIQMAPYASAACMFKQFIGSLGARYLPGYGFKPFTPTQLKPVYFPAWIIDAEAQIELSSEDTQCTTTGVIHDSYLPGSDFRVLSCTPLFDRKLSNNLVPFTKDLENQYGTEIICLPYTISPFSVLDIAHSLSLRGATIEDGLRFSPSSLKLNLFAAYPVLIPLYLAQYEFTLPGLDNIRSLTVFIEASSPTGRILSDKIGADMGQEFRELLPNAPKGLVDFTHLLDNITVQVLRGMVRHFVRVSGLLVPNNRGVAQTVASWLDDILHAPDTAGKLAAKSGPINSDDDLRIREFNTDEKRANLLWMSMSGEIASAKRIVEAMTSAKTSFVVSGAVEKTAPKDIFDATVKTLHEKIAELEAKRIETEPTWWKEWTAKNKL